MVNIVISICVFIAAVVTHEVAHGWAACLMGDNTARDAGRLTLNPLAHVDPIGSIALPAILVFAHSPVIFGWAKPVPVNVMNFSKPRLGLFLTSLAGPTANILLALGFAALFKSGLFPQDSLTGHFLFYGVLISLVLGIFNLIPIPPLDGANILLSLLPHRVMRIFAVVEKYGFIILVVLLYAGFLDVVLMPLVRFATRILLG